MTTSRELIIIGDIDIILAIVFLSGERAIWQGHAVVGVFLGLCRLIANVSAVITLLLFFRGGFLSPFVSSKLLCYDYFCSDYIYS